MPRSKHSEWAIIAALQQLDAARKAADVAREAGVSTYTILRLEGEVRRHGCQPGTKTRQLREENARLKKLVADLSLDKDASQSVIRKMYGPLPDCNRKFGMKEGLRKCIRPLCGQALAIMRNSRAAVLNNGYGLGGKITATVLVDRFFRQASATP